MKLFNTLTRTAEEFSPIKDNTARVYSCGPTVYFTAHIGNLRAYICSDILKKTLRFNGYEVEDVMNITDVGHLVGDGDNGEDKVEKTARKQGVHPLDIAKKYTDQFMKDIARLNIKPAKHIVPATACVAEMIDLIKTLEEKGFTYRTSDGVYFDAARFSDYFALSRGNLEGNRGGIRVDLGEKRNINDFALWKFVGKDTIQKWDSPWGAGCPGWHIECSAISQKYLSVPFDIHTGGIDHIPVHHTNEIAQTECAAGCKMANWWFHNEFMTIDGGKMSKSLGNVYTLDDLEKRGYRPVHFRYLALQSNYRTVMNFTFEALASAKKTYTNIIARLKKHRDGENPTDADELLKEFTDAVNNDLNTTVALAVLNKAVKMPPSKDIYKLVTEQYDAVLSLSLGEISGEAKITVPKKIKELAAKRLTAKKERDFAAADKLRAEIEENGYRITDTADGYEILPK